VINRSQRESPQPQYLLLVVLTVPTLLLSSAFYAVIFLIIRRWQVLVPVFTMLAGAAAVLLGWMLYKRGRILLAGQVTLLASLFVHLGSELVFSGLTVITLLGNIGLVSIAGPLVLPRRRGHWLLAAAVYEVLIAAAAWWSPPFRYDARAFPPIIIFAGGATVLYGLTLVVQLLVFLWRQTIRTRLLVSFVSVVALTAIFGSSGLIITTWQNSQTEALRRLQIVAEFQAAQVDTWTQSAQRALDDLFIQEGVNEYARTFLMRMDEESALVDTIVQLRVTMRRLMVSYLDRTPLFEEIFLLHRSGRVVVSTDETLMGQVFVDQPFFQRGLERNYVQPPSFSPIMNDWTVIVARPVFDNTGAAIGVMAARVNWRDLNEMLGRRMGMGNTGETYLVDAGYHLLTDSRFDGYPSLAQGGETTVRSQGVETALEMGAQGTGVYQNYRNRTVIGVFRYLPSLGVALIAEQEQTEVFREASSVLIFNGAPIGLAVVVSVLLSFFIAGSISTPISKLAQTASRIADGDVNLVAEVSGFDEIGVLSQNFNRMTTQLRTLIGELEQRVRERTLSLETRSAYLQASAEVGRATASILDQELLVQQVVTLIQQRFGFYYVGLFLTDPSGEWAVLRAGTGEAGQAMLARGHRIRVGEGMIGWCIANEQARIALHADRDAARLATLELPDTRSEAALPLRARGAVIGALTVQSSEPEAFDEVILSVLQTMADQVALALDNARLLTESERALQAAQRAYGEFGSQAWAELLRARPEWGYRYLNQRVVEAEGDWPAEMYRAAERGEPMLAQDVGGQFAVALPLRVRGQVIGALRFCKPADQGNWTREQVALLETLVAQLAQALELAQLYESTQRQAAREQAVGQISAEFARALDLDALLRTAVRELGRLPGVSEVSLHIDVPEREMAQHGTAG